MPRKAKIDKAEIQEFITDNIPNLRFEKPVGLPRGAKWEVHVEGTPTDNVEVEETSFDPTTGKINVRVCVPLDLEYTYTAQLSPKG